MLCAVLVVVGTAGAVTSWSGPAAGAASGPTTVDVRTRDAALYAMRRHVRAGVAVLDRKTGRSYLAGQARAEFGAASVMKLFVAARLLARRQMSGRIASLAWSMITRSDNNALQRLLPPVGGTAVVDWAEKYFAIPGLGSPPRSAKRSCWGNTHITAVGIVTFLDRMARNPLVGPWLTNALHHWKPYAADGLDQRFGFAVAARGIGLKQGEGHCSSDTNGSIINSVGLVGHDRFAVAVLTDSHICCNRGGFNREQAAIASSMARTIMPGGRIDLVAWHSPYGGVGRAAALGTTVTVSGWVADPDRPRGPTPVRVVERSTTVRAGSSTGIDAALNARHHLTGRHAFALSFSAKPGTHRYCVRLVNVGQGVDTPAVCRTVRVASG
ncbi:hypothetical protein GCM10027265_22380 [Jatrophihabitans fulvus]